MRTIVMVLCGFVAAAAPHGQVGPESREDAPGMLIVYLANARIPAGLVVGDAALRHVRAGPLPLPADAGERQTAALARRASQAGLTLSSSAERGARHFRAVDAPARVIARLTKPVLLPSAIDDTLSAVLFGTVPGSLMERDVSGMLGSGLFAEGCRLDSRVRIAAGTSSVSAILDAAVEQVPGVVWFVAYPDDAARPAGGERLRVGVVCAGGAHVGLSLDDLP